jgi:hypothetical protein
MELNRSRIWGCNVSGRAPLLLVLGGVLGGAFSLLVDCEEG